MMTSLLGHAETWQSVCAVSVGFYHEASPQGLIDEDVERLEELWAAKMAGSPLHPSLARKLQRLPERVLPVSASSWIAGVP